MVKMLRMSKIFHMCFIALLLAPLTGWSAENVKSQAAGPGYLGGMISAKGGPIHYILKEIQRYRRLKGMVNQLKKRIMNN